MEAPTGTERATIGAARAREHTLLRRVGGHPTVADADACLRVLGATHALFEDVDAATAVGARPVPGQPFTRARNRSMAPLKRSWSPTVLPDEVYCHIVYSDQPAGRVPAVEAYRAIHNGLVLPKPE
jgi:hypothetical protein